MASLIMKAKRNLNQKSHQKVTRQESLNAHFTTRVFEKSGAFSSEYHSQSFHPYQTYVGIKIPSGDKKRNMLLTDEQHKINLVAVDYLGKKASLEKVRAYFV